MNISKNFTNVDVEFDLYAHKVKINNKAPSAVLRNAELLAEAILEPLLEVAQYRVLSWYRSPTLEREYCKAVFFQWATDNRKHFNDASWVEYVKEKQHISGQAVSLMSHDNKALFAYIRDNLEFDILSIRGEYVHVSYAQNANRKMVI